MKRFGLTAIGAAAAALAALIFVATAFALTAEELEPKANEWQAANCNASLLTSKSKKSGERIALCYSLASVARVKQAMAKAEAEVKALEEDLTHLEARAPATADIQLFDNITAGPAVISPVIDASAYSHITFGLRDSQTNVRVEEAGPNEHFVWLNLEACTGTNTTGILEGTVSCPVAAKYYRLKAESGSKEVTAFAHLTDD
jgi:hypothetical protein